MVDCHPKLRALKAQIDEAFSHSQDRELIRRNQADIEALEGHVKRIRARQLATA